MRKISLPIPYQYLEPYGIHIFWFQYLSHSLMGIVHALTDPQCTIVTMDNKTVRIVCQYVLTR